MLCDTCDDLRQSAMIETPQSHRKVTCLIAPCVWASKCHLYRTITMHYQLKRQPISPGHMLRCCTPAMVGSKRAAMPKIRMRCAAIESSTCLIFWYRFWNISAIYFPPVLLFPYLQHCTTLLEFELIFH